MMARLDHRVKIEKEQVTLPFGKWFWVGMIILIPICLYGGMRSVGQEPEAPVEEVTTRAMTRPTETAEEAPQTAEQVYAVGVAKSRANVMQLFQDGLIRRINEKRRLLYVNDPKWKEVDFKQKENTARIVVAYLDWVEETRPGMLDIRSSRNGRQLAEISKGAFRLYR